MNYYRVLIVVAIVIFLVIDSPSQDKQQERPNFSGKWLFESKGKNSVDEHLLEIRHAGDELDLTIFPWTLKTARSAEFKLFTDKRGETNNGFANGNVEIRSKTRWKGDKIERISQFSFSHFISGAGRFGALEETEIYEMSKDRMSLTVLTIAVSTQGPVSQSARAGDSPRVTYKRLYRKV